MKPDFSELHNVYIHQGEACFSRNAIVVSTVLGSCLSITMFSKKKKYAGISHCQLPFCNHCNFDCENCIEPFKYVKCTITLMLKKFEKLNIPRDDIEVKIFGGADVLKISSGKKRISTVGKQNIQMAIDTLAVFNMIPHVMDVGGKVGRKIIFSTGTGEIFLNRLKNNG